MIYRSRDCRTFAPDGSVQQPQELPACLPCQQAQSSHPGQECNRREKPLLLHQPDASGSQPDEPQEAHAQPSHPSTAQQPDWTLFPLTQGTQTWMIADLNLYRNCAF